MYLTASGNDVEDVEDVEDAEDVEDVKDVEDDDKRATMLYSRVEQSLEPVAKNGKVG